MRPVVISASNTDTYGIAARLNYRQSDFKVGFGTKIVSGTPTYSVRHTFEDPANYSGFSAWAQNAVWFDNTDVNAETTAQDGNYLFPIQGVKVIVTSGTGTVQAIFLQGN